ncbi:enoyl-CoA hydratase-related protein, partial [Rhodococcus sp. IEGM 1379]|uniref:enoyl-CoA hydratase-related protein n=1 Tax=Rhodococcus sp. IEGM 1379 TaxID=3047086 RepID=UPI0024B7126C
MSTVTSGRQGRVLIVRIEREERRNAINRETAEGIETALDLLEDDPELWVGIITGTPTVFCAGTDIRERADLRMPRGGEYGIIRRQRNKPLIAAVEGYALG